MVQSASVEALLTLNATGFDTGIQNAMNSVEKLVTSVSDADTSVKKFQQNVQLLETTLRNLGQATTVLTEFKESITTFNQLANAMDKLTKSAVLYANEGRVTVDTFRLLGNGVQAFTKALGGVEVKMTNVVKETQQMNSVNNQVKQSTYNAEAEFNRMSTALLNVANGIQRMSGGFLEAYGDLMMLTRGVEQFNAISATSNKLPTVTFAKGLNNGAEELTKNMDKVSASTDKAGNSAKNAQGSFRGLSNVLSTLKGIGMMVVSMFAYNFLHSLGQAVSETIKARSEMYSMFETMGMTTNQINVFNSALDQTVSKFQRVNKYSMGETVASIGIEFNLSTQEMAKAMDVTSMITSEYLRAGRSAEEASLAVRDIMQGQFQRLSRETGVKQKDLEAAGWDGDTKNVLGLMEALEKVAYSRNWDTFASKANSLNDIIQITQNRFAEWAADTSQYIVPVITGSFNLLITIIDKVTEVFGAIGSALHLPDWAGAAVLVGGFVTALAGLVPVAITARTGLGLLDIAERGLKDSILGAIFGINAEKEANLSSTTAIYAKILGLKAEEVAENGLKAALIEKVGIQNVEAAMNQKTYVLVLGRILGLNMETVATEGVTAAIGRQTIQRLVNIGAMNAEKAAEMGLNSVRLIGIATLGIYALAIAAVVAALAPFIMAASEAAEKQKEFNEFVNNGDNIMRDARETVASYTEKVNKLKEEKSKLTEGTDEYTRKERELAEAERDLNTVTDDMNATYEQLQKARSGLAKHEEAMTQISIDRQQMLEDALRDVGYSADEAKDKIKDYYDVVGAGLDTKIDIEQYGLLTTARLGSQTKILKEQFGDDPEKYNEKVGEKTKIQEEIAKQYQRMQEAEGIFEKADAWLQFEWAQGANWYTDMVNSFESGDWLSGLGNLSMGHPIGILSETLQSLFGDAFANIDLSKGAIQFFDDAFADIDWSKGAIQFFEDSFPDIDIGEWWNSIWGDFDIGEWWNSIWGDKSRDRTAMGGEGNPILSFLGLDDWWTGFSEWAASVPSQITTALDGIFNSVVTTITTWGQTMWSKALEVGNNFYNNIIQPIGQIPSKIWSLLVSAVSYISSAIQQWVTTALNKAQELVRVVVSKVSELPQKVYNEFVKIGQKIRESIEGAVRAATQFGEDVKNAVLNALHIHSPGIIQNKVTAEFEDTVSNIQGTVASAQSVGAEFGQAISSGVTDNLTGSFIMDYNSDASQINSINQTITADTASTFGMLGATVDGTITGMADSVATNYANMDLTQSNMLNGMTTQNRTAFNNIQTQTNTSLKDMRDSTQNVTLQMTKAWSTMKDSIVASANQLKTQSMAHFNTLSSNIGSFYRKLQNPSMWGAGDKVPTRYYNSARGNRGRTAVRRAFGVSGGFAGGGVGQANLPQKMSLRRLRQMMGDSPIFNGWDMNQIVDVAMFLSQFDGGFGWNDWHPAHFSKIKTTTGEYDMKSPQIMHRIQTNANFKPKEFYTGKPTISFGQFQSMAESLFSAIPYDFYYNSDKYGSWQNALQAGACNCFDGASALIALAATCGFGGHMASGTWNGIPHVFAVINGRKMDTTGWQQRRNWNGVSAGGDVKGVGQTTINVTVDMSNSTVYGVDDLDSRIENGVNEAMQSTINPSKIVGY